MDDKELEIEELNNEAIEELSNGKGDEEDE